MAVRTKDHLAAACEHFTGKLVDNGLMRRNIDTAVLLRTGQSKHVVIFIDRTADCTQRVMAVGQNIRDREFLQSGCSRSLDDSDKGNVVRSQLVKFDLKLLHITGSIMRT